MLRVGSIPILAIFPHIPMHVIKAPGVRWVTAYWAGFAQVGAFLGGAVGIVAMAVRLRAIQLLPKMKRRAGAGPTAILPLCIRGQAHRMTGFFVHLHAK